MQETLLAHISDLPESQQELVMQSALVAIDNRRQLKQIVLGSTSRDSQGIGVVHGVGMTRSSSITRLVV